MKSPYGNDFKGDICIVCTNKCELFDIVYVELNGEKIRYSNTNDTYLNDTPYLDLINLDNNSFFKKYGYIIIPKSNTDRDIYDNYIIKKDKEVSILKNNIIINSDYNYVVGDKKIKVLVLANNGEKVTLFVYDENFYKLDELEKLLSIEVNDGDEVRFFDTEDMEVRIKEDSNSGLKPIITYSNDNENTNFWVKNNNENNNENNFIVIHKENDEYKILNNVNSVTTARIGIVIETKNFDKIVSINND